MRHGQLTVSRSGVETRRGSQMPDAPRKRCTSWEPMAQHSAHRPRTPTGAAKASRQHSGTSRCQLTFNPHWRTSIVTEPAARRRTAEERQTRWEKGAPAGSRPSASARRLRQCKGADGSPRSGCTRGDEADMAWRDGSAAWDGAEAATPASRHGSPGDSARVSKAGRAHAARARPYHAGQNEGKVNEKPQRSSKASDHVRN